MHLEELAELNQEDIVGMSRKEYFERHGYEWGHVEKILSLYKHYKTIQKTQVDVHHLCSRASGGRDVSMNREKMLRGEHNTHHEVFGVQLPHQQIIRQVRFNQKVIVRSAQEEIRDRIERLLRKDLFYRRGVIV